MSGWFHLPRRHATLHKNAEMVFDRAGKSSTYSSTLTARTTRRVEHQPDKSEIRQGAA